MIITYILYLLSFSVPVPVTVVINTMGWIRIEVDTGFWIAGSSWTRNF